MLSKQYDFELIHNLTSFQDCYKKKISKPQNQLKQVGKASKNKKLQINQQSNKMKDFQDTYVLIGNIVIDLNILFYQQSPNLNFTERNFGSLQHSQIDKASDFNSVHKKADYNFFSEKIKYYNRNINSVEYFKKSDTFEVVYDSKIDNFYLSSFQEVFDSFDQFKQNTSDFCSNHQSLPKLRILLQRYQDLIQKISPLDDNQKTVNNQFFQISMKIAHNFLILLNKKSEQIEINFFPLINDYLPSPNSTQFENNNGLFFFYNGLKRTEYGYSIDRRGLNKNLIDLLKIDDDMLHQSFLRKGFINFLSPETNLNILLFDLETRIMLAQQQQQKITDISSIKGRQIQAQLITLDLIQIECKIIVDIIPISCNQEGWSQNYLMLFYIQISESEYQKFKVSRYQETNFQQYLTQQQQQGITSQEKINPDFLCPYGYQNQSETFINNFYPDVSYQSSLNSINTVTQYIE